jgi:hypothetical protein
MMHRQVGEQRMANESIQRRQLSFQSLDEVLQDVDHLLEAGYTSAGNWSLSQTCFHLSEWMRFPMDGYPRPSWFMRIVFWFMRMTVAKKMARDILENGFKPGIPTDPRTVPTADSNTDGQAVRELHNTIERFQSFAGPLKPSPLFGAGDKATVTKVNLRHAELHLSFLHPED